MYTYMCIYIYIYIQGTKGVPRHGVVSNNWFEHVLLSMLHMFKPSC